MKKFILNILLLVSLLFIVDRLIGLTFNKIRDCTLVNSKSKLDTHFILNKVEADILIFGNSRAKHHYVPSVFMDSLGCSVYNCGLDGTSFEYRVALIKKVLDRYPPKTILIDIETSLFEDLSEDIMKLNGLYPYFKSDSLIRAFILQEDKMNVIKMQSYMVQNNSQLIDLLKPFVISYEDEYGYDPLKRRMKESLLPKNLTYSSNGKLKEEKLEALRYCVELCKNNNVELIFVISPRFVNSNYKELKSYRYISNILSDSDVNFFDYGDISLLNNSIMFQDGAHLNHDGAVEFSKYFVKDIKRLNSKFVSSN